MKQYICDVCNKAKDEMVIVTIETYYQAERGKIAEIFLGKGTQNKIKIIEQHFCKECYDKTITEVEIFNKNKYKKND